MKRISAFARSLMFAAMALVVLAQSLALASMPVASTAAVTAVASTMQPPCHQQDQPAQDLKQHAMPCCDEEDGCSADDCSLQCYRIGAQFLGVPLLLTAAAHFAAQVPPNKLASALPSRQPIPPLPPPISA